MKRSLCWWSFIPNHIPNTSSTLSTLSLHNKIRDKIVEIGRLLGLESDSEVKVAKSTKVDAIREENIGNMGKVIYVFKIQSKGPIDSLILNLIKANQFSYTNCNRSFRHGSIIIKRIICWYKSRKQSALLDKWRSNRGIRFTCETSWEN